MKVRTIIELNGSEIIDALVKHARDKVGIQNGKASLFQVSTVKAEIQIDQSEEDCNG